MTFEIDEVAIVAYSGNGERVDEEVIIESELFVRIGRFVYKVRFSDGWHGYYEPRYLRKKKPPKWEELQELMNWSPEGVTV